MTKKTVKLAKIPTKKKTEVVPPVNPVPPKLAVDNSGIDWEGVPEKVKTELVNLKNISKLLQRVKDLQGDEAFVYVQCQNYLHGKMAILTASATSQSSA